MSFDLYEKSDESSVPAELFAATSGSLAYYFTSAPFKIPHAGVTYEPVAMSRGGLKTKPSGEKNELTMELPSDHPVPQLFAGSSPNAPVNIVITRYQLLEGLADTIVFFEGIVRSVVFNGKQAEITIVPLESGIQRQMPRRTFASLCQHELYNSDSCKATRASFDHTGEVSAVVSNEITVTGADAFIDGYFSGGEIVSGLERFWIITHVGTVMTILGTFKEDIIGEDATVYAGCTHDPVVCANKFNNFVNYGGCPYIPLKNVYQSGIL